VIRILLFPKNIVFETIFRYKTRWWKKTAFNEGVALTSNVMNVQFLPTNMVAVRGEDLPSQIYTNCI